MPSFSCDQCLVPFKRREHLANHLRQTPTNHILRCFKCDHCSQSFKSKENLPAHFQEKHGWNLSCDLPFECELCGNKYRHSNCLQRHLASIHRDVTFDCDACGKRFASRSLLRNHIISVHERLRLFECRFCDAKFTLSNNLTNHLGHVHDRSMPLAICDYCGKSCLKHSLVGHIRTHTEKKDLRLYCGFCSASYSNPGPLRFHMALNHPETQSSHRLIECDDCGAKCRAQHALLKHINIVHLKLRPFHCLMCDASFSGPGNLKVHTEAVHTTKALVCDVCSKTYSSCSKEHLAWHYRKTHVDSKSGGA